MVVLDVTVATVVSLFVNRIIDMIIIHKKDMKTFFCYIKNM